MRSARALADRWAREAEDIPEPWQAIAAVVREELERRERDRALAAAVMGAVSPDAAQLLLALQAAGGVALLLDLPGPPGAVRELQTCGFVAMAWTLDEAGHAAEPVVMLRLDAAIPGT